MLSESRLERRTIEGDSPVHVHSEDLGEVLSTVGRNSRGNLGVTNFQN